MPCILNIVDWYILWVLIYSLLAIPYSLFRIPYPLVLVLLVYMYIYIYTYIHLCVYNAHCLLHVVGATECRGRWQARLQRSVEVFPPRGEYFNRALQTAPPGPLAAPGLHI